MDYYFPETLKEAEKIKKNCPDSVFLAGGTIVNWRRSPAGSVIDLSRLDLKKIKKTAKCLSVETLVTVQELLENSKTPEPLKKASRAFNSINIRNQATVGGNLCDRFTVSNLLPVFLSYDARISFFYTGKTKNEKLLDWISDKKGIITAISIPLNTGIKVALEETKISELDVSSVVTSAGYSLSRDIIKKCLISVSGASGNTQALHKSSEYLKGQKLSSLSFDDLMNVISKEIKLTGSVKLSKRVKLRIIEDHLRKTFKG